MSSDSHSEKNIEKTTKSDSAESNLDNPDAQDAREADKDTITEIGKQNPDNWMSAGGHFAIVDENQVLASRDVTEENGNPVQVDNNQNLSVELQAIKDSGNPEQSQLAEHIQDMRSAAKEKGLGTAEIDKFAKETFTTEGKEEQFERGAFKSLSAEQANGSEPLSTTDQPVGGYEQENRADGGITLKGVIPGDANNNWQTIVSRVSELPIDKQFEIIGNGLQAFNNELNHQKLEIAVGTIEGIGEGFKSLGDGVVSLANGLGQISEFSADVMTNNPRAIETGAQAGEAIGKTLVGGVKLFHLSHDYLYNIGFTGDYAKPFNDIANLGNELNRRWQEMPTKERAKLAAKLSTETIASAAIPLGANKLAKTEKVTELMEEFAAAAKGLGKESKAIDAIEETVDTLSKKGGRSMELGGDLVTSTKRKIHDRRHLKDVEELANIARGYEIKIDNQGASPEFMDQLKKYIDRLDPHEKIFLAERNIEVVGCKTMRSVRPDSASNTAGMYVRSEKRIYVPEKVYAHEIDNPAVEFHLRHEFGHAFNDFSEFQDPFSNTKAFKTLYDEVYDQLDQATIEKLRLTKTYKEYAALGGDNGLRYSPEYSRHEVFADLYGHITGIGSRTEFSELIERAFGKNCEKHIREIVVDYMNKLRQKGK